MTTTHTEIESVTIEEAFPYVEDGDPNAKAHIVDYLGNIRMNEIFGVCVTASEIVQTARMLGLEVLALCGHTWVPVRNPDDKDTCEKCLTIWKMMR
jgi:hypothetical protein